MKWIRVRAVCRKETLHILRDWRSLAIGIAIPVLMLFLFGFALTLDVDKVPTIVWDQSGTPASQDYLSRYLGSPYFSLLRYARSYVDIESAIDRREALVGLIIPVNFAGRLQSGRSVSVQLILDGSDSNTATIALGYAKAVSNTFSQEILLRQARRNAGVTFAPPLDLRPRVWYNEDLESRNYIIPGLIAVIMMVIAALLTSLTVAREWETGTMEQLLSTPVKRYELILGKLIPYFGIGMLDMFLSVIMAKFVFHVPLRGDVVLLFGMAGIFLIGGLSLGILISILAGNQLLACQLALIGTFLPSFLLSGFVFDIGNMPEVLQWITYVVPARYFVTVLKGIYMKGVGMEVLAREALFLGLFAAIVFLLANLKFRRKMV